MIGIVDYNAGNIKSVERALGFLKADYILSKNPKDLEKADKLIFPGVGEAAYAMDQLKKTGFDLFLKDWAKAQKPLMGICLGSQIIFDWSEEGGVECLGLLHGKVNHFKTVYKNNSVESDLKIPHMGWNNLEYINGSSALFDGVDKNQTFILFTHI